MATTVGATLGSSMLAVTQDDLHLVGSTVDQLTVQFNQLAFDEFLAADQSCANNKHRPEDRQATTKAATPSSLMGSAPSSDDDPVRTHRPSRESEIPWGLLNHCRR